MFSRATCFEKQVFGEFVFPKHHRSMVWFLLLLYVSSELKKKSMCT